MRRPLVELLTKSGVLFGSGQAPGTTPGALPSTPKPAPAAPIKPVTTPSPTPTPTTVQPTDTVAQHAQPSAPPTAWSNLTGAIGMIPGSSAFMPPQYEQAGQWYNQTQDPNTSWMSSQKWDAAKNLNNWFNQNQSHPAVSAIKNLPQVQQGLSQFNGPMGQVGQYVAPLLGKLTQSPEQFAQFLNMPVIRDLFKNTVGQAGIPGLALAHSFMSGNMGNWNALTAGLRDPSQRMAGRNFYNELGQLFNKHGTYRLKSKPDIIDEYLARVHCAKRR